MFTNSQIATLLGSARIDLRNGVRRVYYSQNGKDALRTFFYLRFNVTDLSAFKKPMQKRLETLFDVPQITTAEGSTRFPTQDETAWALQNFINRRAEPWAFFTRKAEALDTAQQPSV